MASITCAKCGMKLASDVERCPRCGTGLRKGGLGWREGILIASLVAACFIVLQSQPSDDAGIAPPPGEDAAAAVPGAEESATPLIDRERLRISEERAEDAVDEFMADTGLAADELEASTGMDQAQLVAQVRAELYVEPDVDPAVTIRWMQTAKSGTESSALAALVASGDQ